MRIHTIQPIRPSSKKSEEQFTTPRAWIAEGWVNHEWRLAQSSYEAALIVFAISVQESFSVAIRDRLHLINDVADYCSSRVPAGVPSLYVFPGGFFGFDALNNKWRRFHRNTLRQIEEGIQSRVCCFPFNSLIAIGVDNDTNQQALIAGQNQGSIRISKITRGETSLACRQFTVGSVRIAFFICGEFTGSQTYQNGPFCINENGRSDFLENPIGQLPTCNVLVDLAHHRVSGSTSGICNPRMVHRRQMIRFSRKGVALLAHHHAGLRVDGRSHFKHQSNWIVFRGGRWLTESKVVELA